jgi:hypothetical protein
MLIYVHRQLMCVDTIGRQADMSRCCDCCYRRYLELIHTPEWERHSNFIFESRITYEGRTQRWVQAVRDYIDKIDNDEMRVLISKRHEYDVAQRPPQRP